MGDKNLRDGDIEPAPKLIQVVFQNCKGQVDHWVEPCISITIERLRRSEKPYLKCLLIQVIADTLYYNASLTLNIRQKLGVATAIFNLWFQVLGQNKKVEHGLTLKGKTSCSLTIRMKKTLQMEEKGVLTPVMLVLREHDKKVCCLQRKNGLQTDEDDDDNDDDSGKEMGVDAEEGDEADNNRLKEFAAQVKAFRAIDEDDRDYSNDFSDNDEDLQSPIDEVDPFILFVENIKAMQASDQLSFQSLTQTLGFYFQALAKWCCSACSSCCMIVVDQMTAEMQFAPSSLAVPFIQ